VFVFLLNGTASLALVDPWEDYTIAGNVSVRQGRLLDAANSFELAIKEAEKASSERYVGRSRLAESLQALADVRLKQARFADAERLYKRALAESERVAIGFGKDFDEADTGLSTTTTAVVTNLEKLAEVSAQEGKFADALPLYERLLHIWETSWFSNSPELAIRIVKIADLYETHGDRRRAQQLYNRAASIYKHYFDPHSSHPGAPPYPGAVAKALYDYATLLRKMNEPEKATAAEAEAKAIQVRLSKNDL
jgi:tetratricopeptide (TPR) repeat protein